jgi:hypothetical protein
MMFVLEQATGFLNEHIIGTDLDKFLRTTHGESVCHISIVIFFWLSIQSSSWVVSSLDANFQSRIY